MCSNDMFINMILQEAVPNANDFGTENIPTSARYICVQMIQKDN